ncbi:unnamed protein product [Ranitomeya imitator]|uniref:ribonuclease H n=1 Tax=Ranitomeya imitator TaxID=111125 RepID=A0ABN9L6Y7_9NEOB|nr:unnamed protein product [Ranitomeya imitator]
MFTLVTGIVGRWRAVCVTALQRPNSDAAAIRIVVGSDIYNEFCPVEVMELRKSLIELYNHPKFRKLQPFPSSSHVSIDLSSLFADVSIVSKSITNKALGVMTLPDILTDLNDITMIEGEVGSGKTALLRKIALLWASGSCPILSRFSIVFYISLISVGRHQSLSDTICQQLIGSSTLLTQKSLQEIIKKFKNRVLFLLDDYGVMDSLPESIEELIKMNHWNRLSLAVAVNTDKGRNLRQYARATLSIQEFPNSSSIYIFKNLFSHNLSIVEGITMKLISTNTLQLVLKSPLLTFCLCVLWVQDPTEKVSIDTLVWKSYLMHIFLRHPTETETINAVVLSCEELAINNLFKSRFEFTNEDLRESAVNIDDALKYKILSRFTSQRLHPIFKFFHPSFQEFLAGKRMNELLQSGDARENEKGLTFLQSIDTISKVIGPSFYFLKYTCMHSPKSTTAVISHMFNLLESSDAFHCQRDKKNVHLQQHPELEIMESFLSLSKVMENLKSLMPSMGFNNESTSDVILNKAIALAEESNHLSYCAPIILSFLKGKTISMVLSWPNIGLLRFFHRYPEGLWLLKRMEIVVPPANISFNMNFLSTESFKSLWSVPTVDADYANAFELTSNLQQNAHMPALEYLDIKINDLSTLGFSPEIHRILLLTVKVDGCPVESENILVNIMFFCSLSIQIGLDLNNCPGFLESMWPCIDQYKGSITSLKTSFTKLTIEDQELIAYLTSLQSLKIISMPPPEFVLSNIHSFKELKELVVICPIGENKWEIVNVLSDECKCLHNIEKIVLENICIEGQANRLGDPALCNIDAFFLALGLLYDEPNSVDQAEKNLLALCQGQDEIEIYCQKFRKWSVLTQWNECALAAIFRKGLSEALKDVMVGFPMPAGLNESMSLAIQIGRRLRERKSVHHLAVVSEHKPEPMQCDRTLTRAERQGHRRQNGLCFYCGDSTHAISDCPKRTKRFARSATIGTVQSKFLLSVTLICYLSSYSVMAFVDSGAALNLMDLEFARRCGFDLEPLQCPIPLRGIDATPLAKNKPQYWTQLTMCMAPAHQEDIRFLVLHNLHDVVVLGLPWLQVHNPVLDWKSMSVSSWGCQGVHGDVPFLSISSSTPSEVPEFLSDYRDVFDEPKSNALPPHRDCDCAIDLIPGSKFPKGRLFNLSVPEYAAMRSYVKESLEKGHIRPSSSPLGAGFFFVAKKDGSLRPCIDYRLLNKITVKFQYPLPLLSDLFARIKGASWFTKIDLRGAYNLVRIKRGDEWKTAFNTPEGHFEYLVMPFGLSNAPSVFQSFMHDIFREYLDKFLIVYLDDILVFSDDWESHVKQVRMVFQVLRANSLFVKGSKCLFGVQKV